MLDQNSYDTHKNRENILNLRIVLRELPPFAGIFPGYRTQYIYIDPY